jgi:putative ABC transport system permease protein
VNLISDFRLALRGMRKNPGFAAVVICVLALGIGANTAIFSVADAVLLRPLPYHEPERIMELSESIGGQPGMSLSYPNFQDWEKQQRVFESLAVSMAADETLTGEGYPERVNVTYVSHQFLAVYALKPVMGRDFGPAHDRLNPERVLLLSNGSWITRYGSDPNILGRKVVIDKEPFTVGGVLPPFPFHRGGEYFLPIGAALNKYMLLPRYNHNNTSVHGRLKPGVTLEQARAQMSTVAARLAKEYPTENAGRDASVIPLSEWLAGSVRNSVLLLLGAVGLVLLVACANIANLLLARASAREKEVAIRSALGASRWQIIRQLLVESVTLSLAGAIAGIAVAHGALQALLAFLPDMEKFGGAAIDGRVLAFAACAAVATGVLFGMAPALHLVRLGLAESMKGAGKSSAHGPKLPVRRALVVLEVALALVLLTGAGLLMRSFHRLMNVDPGFRPESVMTAKVRLPGVMSAEITRAPQAYTQLAERLESLPQVQSAGLVNRLPLAGSTSSTTFYRSDRPAPEKGQYPDAIFRIVSPSYFETLRIPLLRGRIFTAQDGQILPMAIEPGTPDATPEELMNWWRAQRFRAVISETMARQIWPNEDAVGKHFRIGYANMNGPNVEVVGVVGNTRHWDLAQGEYPEYYLSSYHFPENEHTIVLRTTADPGGMADAVRKAAAEIMPSAVVSDFRTMERVVAESVSSRRTNLMVLVIFSAMALLLACVGTYGVLAYLVSQRTHEIGIRMALGAEARNVVGLVLREALLLGGVGLAIGVAVSAALARLIASMLYGVTTWDVPAYAAALAALAIATFAAAWIPAHRAAKVDPLIALRDE